MTDLYGTSFDPDIVQHRSDTYATMAEAKANCPPDCEVMISQRINGYLGIMDEYFQVVQRPLEKIEEFYVPWWGPSHAVMAQTLPS